MAKTPVSWGIMIGIGILFIMLYIAGINIGKGITDLITKIHPVGWILIFLIFIFWMTKGKK